jgi:uncharacterized protein YegL
LDDRMAGPYTAPECFREASAASAPSDIFSFGLIVFELFAGGKAFDSAEQMFDAQAKFPHPPSALNPEFPKGLDEWLQRMCAFEPSARPTAQSALEEFEAILAEDALERRGERRVESLSEHAPSHAGSKSKRSEERVSPFREFTTPAARPLPVILLLDTSGSMSAAGKIDVLNESVRDMVSTFADEDAGLAEIHIAVITFGGAEARVHIPFERAQNVRIDRMVAAGRTPLGRALQCAAELIEDRESIPARAYRPVMVLVSDGIPTDDWQAGATKLNEGARASKAFRFALAVGADAERDVLRNFAGEHGRIFEAHEARDIRKFFSFVTMTVTTQTQSATPNSIPILETDLNEVVF